MKINCASAIAKAFSCAAFVLIAACSSPQVVPPPSPQPVSKPAPPPPPVPSAAVPRDWRDASRTPGDWRYEQRSEGGVARYGLGPSTVFILACNRASGTISLIRSGSSAVSLPMSIATTSEIRALSAEPAPGGQPQLVATVRTQDAVLDAMVFSRGRFAVEVNGLPTLYLPAWPEIGRVVEDCRAG